MVPVTEDPTRRIPLRVVLDGVAVCEYVGCDPGTEIEGLTTDSRVVREGVGFVALRGETVDGHTFVAQALARGAPVAVVSRGAGTWDGPAVRVEDTARALGQIAANLHGHPGRRLALAGVTGTNGKTTVSYLLAQALARSGRLHLRMGTCGDWVVDREVPSRFTTPFPLELHGRLAQALARGAVAGVMEVSSHALAQGRVDGLAYRAVGLTSFSQDHLDFHPDMAAYLAAKVRLAKAHLDPAGVAVAAASAGAAAEAFLQAAVRCGARIFRAGRETENELRARGVRGVPGGTELDVRTPEGDLRVRTGLVGDFNVDNVLVTIGLALGLGLGLEEIAAGLEGAAGAPGRLEPVVLPGISGPRVYVDYAHTPDAVARVLAAVRPSCVGALVVVLGCGGDRDRSKRGPMGAAAAAGADRVYATSDNPRGEDPDAIVDEMIAGVRAADRGRVVREVDRARAIARAIAEARPADTVVIAGKGHEAVQIVGAKTVPFDDREHAREALARRGG